jgi:mono/diheme cytochrome c family protein
MRPSIRLAMVLPVIVLSTVLLSACGDRILPVPTVAPAGAPPQPTTQAVGELAPADLVRGQQVYFDKQCVACHNASGTGGIGASLAGTTLSFDQFLSILRNAVPPKPAFNEAELPRQDAYDVYSWLKSLKRTGTTAAESTPDLGAGKVLGMSLWVGGKCDTCHGAFAQGSATGTPLAGFSGTFEQERDRMRRSAPAIKGHSMDAMDDATFERLYQWLKAGADPDSGC